MYSSRSHSLSWLNSTFRNGAKNFFCCVFAVCGRRVPAVTMSNGRRRSSYNDNDTKLDTVVTATTNLNSKKCSILLHDIHDNVKDNNAVIQVKHVEQEL